MKFAVFFLLCCLALASAAPQLWWPGYTGYTAPGVIAPGVISPLGRTVVAGPTVVNGVGGRLWGPYGTYF